MGRPSVALLRPAVLGLGLLLVAATSAPAVFATARPTSLPASQAPTARGAGVTNRPPTSDKARERSTATQRPRRHVIVNDLPTNPHRAPLYQPKLLSPSVKAQQGPSAPTTLPEVPTPATVTMTNPVVEAVSGAGTTDPISPNALEPPDPWVAAGPDTIVQATNVGLRMTDRAIGTVKDVSLHDFFLFGLPGYEAAQFDPHVIYDGLHGRWIATEASFDCQPSGAPGGATVGNGYIDVAVSDNADPRLGWSIVSIPFADQIPDYPGLGTSTDKVVLSANLFGLVSDGAALLGCRPDEATPLGAEVDILGWAQLLGTGTPDFDYYNLSNSGQIVAGDWTFRPALQVPAATSTVHGIVDRTGAVGYFSVTGLPPGNTVLTVSTLPSSTIAGFGATPPPPQQPGPDTIAMALDGRPTDAIWQNNRLVFTSTFGCDPAGVVIETRDCVRVSELNTSTVAPTLTQDFVVGEEGEDLYMPGIGLSGGSDLHVVWTRSSTTAGDFPSTYAAYQLKGAAPNTLTGRLEITHGTSTYGGERWGDYVGVAQDPQVSDAVWTADEYATAAGDGNDWATEVSQLRTFAGASYTPITPLRILDTRSAGSGGVFIANVARSFIVAPVGSIPANAIAVTGNVTIVNQTAAGYVSVTPNLTSNPTSSTINFPVGDVRANNFSLPVGPAGKLSAVYKAVAGKTTNVIIDITGYFVAGPTQNRFHPLAVPARVIDTRSGTGLVGPFVSGTPRTLVVWGRGGVPSNATAITGNLTVVGQTKAGYLSVTPEKPLTTPPTSTLNFPLGDIRANGLTAVLNGSGALSITYTAVAGATTNVILDVTGFYTHDGTGLLFYPLNPGRMMDSRGTILSGGVPAGPLVANVYKRLDTDGHWGVPVGAGGVTGNLTVVGQTQAGYLADTPTAAVGISTLNFPLGDIRANGITVPLGSGNQYIVYRAATGKTTNAILDVTGYFK